MSYGLFHTGGEVGYPNDKAVFTGLGMNTFYMAAAYLACSSWRAGDAGAGCCWAWCCLTSCRTCFSPWKARPGISGAFWRFCGRCCFSRGLSPGLAQGVSGQAGFVLCRVLHGDEHACGMLRGAALHRGGLGDLAVAGSPHDAAQGRGGVLVRSVGLALAGARARCWGFRATCGATSTGARCRPGG